MTDELRKVAAWHEEHAGHGGAGQEWHERCASAVTVAADTIEAKDAEIDEYDRLANAVMHWREWLLTQPGSSHQRERAVIDAYEDLGEGEEYRQCSDCAAKDAEISALREALGSIAKGECLVPTAVAFPARCSRSLGPCHTCRARGALATTTCEEIEEALRKGREDRDAVADAWRGKGGRFPG